MSLHPKIEDLLYLIAGTRKAGKRKQLHELSPAEARRDYDRGAVVLDILPLVLPHVENLKIPTRDGQSIAARLYAPQALSWATPMPVLLFFHGGGFVVGSLDSHDSLCRSLATRTPCAVLSVDYRLAPEFQFPTAIHDAMDALQWLIAEGAQHGLDTARIAVGGDSAGGTIAAVLTLQARDADIALALQLLIYPGTGSHQDTDSHQRFAEGYLLSATTVEWFFRNYLRTEADRSDWRFAPLLHDDLTSLAPAWVAVAEYDPLHDEGVAYAHKLKAAGVPTTLRVYPGMVHEFFKLGGLVPEMVTAHDEAAQALAWGFDSMADSNPFKRKAG